MLLAFSATTASAQALAEKSVKGAQLNSLQTVEKQVASSTRERNVQQLAFTPEYYNEITETMTEIPYNFTDDYDIYKGGSIVYINQPLVFDAINRIGVHTVYYGGMNAPAPGEEPQLPPNESQIGWAEVKPYSTTGVTDVLGAGKAESVRYYNAAGVASDNPFDGINIVVKKMSDGSIKVEKIIK